MLAQKSIKIFPACITGPEVLPLCGNDGDNDDGETMTKYLCAGKKSASAGISVDVALLRGIVAGYSGGGKANMGEYWQYARFAIN